MKLNYFEIKFQEIKIGYILEGLKNLIKKLFIVNQNNYNS